MIRPVRGHGAPTAVDRTGVCQVAGLRIPANVTVAPVERERGRCLDEQGRERGGSEPMERILPRKQSAIPTRRVAMDVTEEVLQMRHECGRLNTTSPARAGCRQAKVSK